MQFPFLAAIDINAIIVPFTDSVKSKIDDFIKIAHGEIIIEINDNDSFEIKKTNYNTTNSFYDTLRDRGHPGLVYFRQFQLEKVKHQFMI